METMSGYRLLQPDIFVASCTKTICVTENVNNFVDKVDKIWENSTLKC